jgi:primase-polymerase (primpol)-like protein
MSEKKKSEKQGRNKEYCATYAQVRAERNARLRKERAERKAAKHAEHLKKRAERSMTVLQGNDGEVHVELQAKLPKGWARQRRRAIARGEQEVMQQLYSRGGLTVRLDPSFSAFNREQLIARGVIKPSAGWGK